MKRLGGGGGGGMLTFWLHLCMYLAIYLRKVLVYAFIETIMLPCCSGHVLPEGQHVWPGFIGRGSRADTLIICRVQPELVGTGQAAGLQR